MDSYDADRLSDIESAYDHHSGGESSRSDSGGRGASTESTDVYTKWHQEQAARNSSQGTRERAEAARQDRERAQERHEEKLRLNESRHRRWFGDEGPETDEQIEARWEKRFPDNRDANGKLRLPFEADGQMIIEKSIAQAARDAQDREDEAEFAGLVEPEGIGAAVQVEEGLRNPATRAPTIVDLVGRKRIGLAELTSHVDRLCAESWHLGDVDAERQWLRTHVFPELHSFVRRDQEVSRAVRRAERQKLGFNHDAAADLIESGKVAAGPADKQLAAAHGASLRRGGLRGRARDDDLLADVRAAADAAEQAGNRRPSREGAPGDSEAAVRQAWDEVDAKRHAPSWDKFHKLARATGTTAATAVRNYLSVDRALDHPTHRLNALVSVWTESCGEPLWKLRNILHAAGGGGAREWVSGVASSPRAGAREAASNGDSWSQSQAAQAAGRLAGDYDRRHGQGAFDSIRDDVCTVMEQGLVPMGGNPGENLSRAIAYVEYQRGQQRQREAAEGRRAQRASRSITGSTGDGTPARRGRSGNYDDDLLADVRRGWAEAAGGY